MSERFTETLHDDYAQSLGVTKVLYENNSSLQHIQVFENDRFGRVLTLDGVVQTTQGDEFIYHEMLTHVPILAHGNATRILIIGGGDGGMAREVLHHKSVEKVTMVEIDEGVVPPGGRHVAEEQGRTADLERVAAALEGVQQPAAVKPGSPVGRLGVPLGTIDLQFRVLRRGD